MYMSEVEGKGGVRARVVAHSISNGIPICTLELRYPRFIHSEFMTHRVFSRNASSSRAIPVQKMIGQVQENPAMPIHWGKNKPGMQADEECTNEVIGPYTSDTAHEMWKEYAQGDCVNYAKAFSEAGYHKQIVNRLLEPFQFINVVVTATEWDNFFNLRLHKDAQPEIYELARVMKQAMDESKPNIIEGNYWHVPYVEDGYIKGNHDYLDYIKCSVARCARVSYLNHDNTSPDVEKDVALHDMLLEAGHMSPFEHVATPMDWDSMEIYDAGTWSKGVTHVDVKENLWSSNFLGWIQYRNLV